MAVTLTDVSEQLSGVLKEALNGAEKWSYFTDHGAEAGLLGTLAKLTAAQASQPIGGTSIAAHVHHISFGCKVSDAWIRGERGPQDWAQSWTVSTVDETAWQRMQEELLASATALQQALQSDALRDVMSLGGAVGAVAHVAYHLGAIKQKVASLK